MPRVVFTPRPKAVSRMASRALRGHRMEYALKRFGSWVGECECGEPFSGKRRPDVEQAHRDHKSQVRAEGGEQDG